MYTSQFPPAPAPSFPRVTETLAEPAALTFTTRRALWIVLHYFAVQFGLVFLATVALAAVRGALSRESTSVAQSSMEGGEVLLLAMFGALLGSFVAYDMTRRSFARDAQPNFARVIGWQLATSRQLFWAAAIGFACIINAMLWMHLFPPPPSLAQNPMVMAAAQHGWQRWTWVSFALIVAPLTEEFMYRGVLFAGLARRSVLAAACLSTLSFTLMHVSGAPYWPALASIMWLGACAQGARIWTGSLLPGMVMHAVYNATLVLIVLAQP